MFAQRFTQDLRPEEEVIKLVRPTLIKYFGHFLISVLFIVAAFFLLYPLFSLGKYGILVFFLLLSTGLVYGLKFFMIYSLTALLITNLRIIDFNQKGFFSKEVSEIVFENIEDISYNKKGILATIFGYATLEIQTAAQKANIEVAGIKNPSQVQNIITDLIPRK